MAREQSRAFSVVWAEELERAGVPFRKALESAHREYLLDTCAVVSVGHRSRACTRRPCAVCDLPIMQWDTWLLVPRARVECPRCGPTVEAVPWLDKYARMTTRPRPE